MKQTRKTSLFKKLDTVVMEKQLECIYPFPSVLYFTLHIYSLDQAKIVLNVTKSEH